VTFIGGNIEALTVEGIPTGGSPALTLAFAIIEGIFAFNVVFIIVAVMVGEGT